MATVQGMSWDQARRAFLDGYESYQAYGARQLPWKPGDKRCGLWTAGGDAARKRIQREKAWNAFLAREKAVM